MEQQSNTYTFQKEATGKWYIVLPDYPGLKADLEMVEGADIMLDHVGAGEKTVTLELSETLFPGSSVLTLVHDYSKEVGGGGIYHLKEYADEQLDQDLWLCEVTEFVFGKLPQNIYFKKISCS